MAHTPSETASVIASSTTSTISPIDSVDSKSAEVTDTCLFLVENAVLSFTTIMGTPSETRPHSSSPQSNFGLIPVISSMILQSTSAVSISSSSGLFMITSFNKANIPLISGSNFFIKTEKHTTQPTIYGYSYQLTGQGLGLNQYIVFL